MNLLDMRTVIVSSILSSIISTLVIAGLWSQNRKWFPGLGYWLVNFVLQSSALVLIALRGVVPDLWSMTISNTLIIGGIIILYIGLERFLGKTSSQLHNAILLIVFFIIHAYFVFVSPILKARTILLSLGLLVTCSQCAWLLLQRVESTALPFTRGTGLVFLGYSAASILRIAFDLTIPLDNELFRSNIYDTAVILTYQMLGILLTFSLFLMVNRRLFGDLDDDIAMRKQTEKELRLSEEKFYKAFHSSPDAILITRLSDGQIVDVNEGFCRITGYSRQEALSSSTVSLGLWVSSQDRQKFTAALKEHRRVRDQEFEFYKKSGEVVTGLCAGEIIQLGGVPHILAVVRDISDQKLSERLSRLRLELWELAATLPLEALMQRALDEIGALTGSPIGFYHFVEADQKTLSLQVWSTRTLAEFCRAEGSGLHYSIDEAGVWVDAFHQRKPVIHNDYASLAHRKGMPAGHAEVVRELVVPVLREGLVVSILGVGNKPSEYDDDDIELVSFIADEVWTIVEQKRANDRIRQLNAQLERLAMTDELTEALNRRSFFQRGIEETNRYLRYQTPFSVLVLDLDGFKNINDTYGHDAGDQVLRCVSKTLRQHIRKTDVLARLGGEEFGIILANTGLAEAEKAAEKLRLDIETQRCQAGNQTMSVTASIGVAAASGEIIHFDALLKNADTAMYQAKNQGKNQVVVYR